jgi:hypothetical protein
MISTDADPSISPCLVGFASDVEVLFAMEANRYMRAVAVDNKI